MRHRIHAVFATILAVDQFEVNDRDCRKRDSTCGSLLRQCRRAAGGLVDKLREDGSLAMAGGLGNVKRAIAEFQQVSEVEVAAVR